MKLATPEMIERFAAAEPGYQRLDSVEISEPRLPMIARRLQALLRVVQLESGGEPIEIDGFRLRDPAMWRSAGGSAFGELWHISNACNMHCPFCYEEGDPEESSVLNDSAGMASMEEIETRLRLRDAGRALFRPITNVNEIFCNPRAMDIIERLREEEPDEVLTFVTNGTYLTRDVVQRLARLKPIFFNYSVNSLDPRIRRHIFQDDNPSVAIEALDLLAEYEIPYLGSLVCWPTIPFTDIEATVRRLDQAGCAIVRYSLSAYSKNLTTRRFEREIFWEEGAALAARLQREVATPIKVEPYHFTDPTYEPNVVGCIQGSPAAAAGIGKGDRLVAVNGAELPSSNHALSALSQAWRKGMPARLTVERRDDGARREIVLASHRSAHIYPYSAMIDFGATPWGILIVDNLKFSYLKEMRAIIDARGARRVLLLSSELMEPIVRRMIEVSGSFRDVDLDIRVPENQFFGGTIIIGDLLVVDDYVSFLQAYVAQKGRPDVVLIPSSPFSSGAWLRDLTGRPFTEIEQRIGVPVALLQCTPIQG